MLTYHGPLYCFCLLNFGRVVVVTVINDDNELIVCDPLLDTSNTIDINAIVNSPCVARCARQTPEKSEKNKQLHKMGSKCSYQPFVLM